MDELGWLELWGGGGGRRVAEGAFSGSQRGSAGGVCREVGGPSDAAGTKLAGSRVLPAKAGGLGSLITMSLCRGLLLLLFGTPFTL